MDLHAAARVVEGMHRADDPVRCVKKECGPQCALHARTRRGGTIARAPLRLALGEAHACYARAMRVLCACRRGQQSNDVCGNGTVWLALQVLDGRVRVQAHGVELVAISHRQVRLRVRYPIWTPDRRDLSGGGGSANARAGESSGVCRRARLRAALLQEGAGSVEYQSLEVLAKHRLLEFTQPVWYHRLGPMLCPCMLAPCVAGASRCSPV